MEERGSCAAEVQAAWRKCFHDVYNVQGRSYECAVRRCDSYYGAEWTRCAQSTRRDRAAAALASLTRGLDAQPPH
jgi:hypothetical protein